MNKSTRQNTKIVLLLPYRKKEISPVLVTTIATLLVFAILSGCAKKVLPPVRPLTAKQQQSQQVINATERALHHFYNDWKGTPYKMGGMSKRAVDCSALTLFAYRDIFGVQLPRTVEEQAGLGREIPPHALKPGDLVFFKTGFFQRHVGIFLKNKKFLHASSSNGVMISRLDEPYWQRKYWKANRAYRF